MTSKQESNTEEILNDLSSSEDGTEENKENSKEEAKENNIECPEQNSSNCGTDLDAGTGCETSSLDQSLESHESEREEKKQSSKPDPDENSNSKCTNQGSPRGVLEITVSGSMDSDAGTSSEVYSGDQSLESQSMESKSNGEAIESHTLQWRSLISGLILRRKKMKSMTRASTFPPSVTTKSSSFRKCLERIRSGKEQQRMVVMPMSEEMGKWRPSWRSFDYQELVDATSGFSQDNLIGKGGHAEVYRGQLTDGQLVAVKRLTKGKNEEDRIADFLSELGIIAHVNHPNAAQLLGFSAEQGLHMVLQFSPHGSLASLLHGTKEGLEWKVRFKIAIGIAEGLLYLHEGCHRRIIHRDIKASNILLTEDYQPQISDFGLAKWLPDKWPYHIVSPIEGTFGYLAPEYFMHGVVNEGTDVFAFGVLLLELITGRKAVDSSRQSLVIWAKPLLDSNNFKELIDPVLAGLYEPEEMSRLISVASMCIHHLSTSRPSMNSVVRLIRGEEGTTDQIGRELKPKIVRPPIFDACDSEDYTCSRYLNDLNRYKQLALEQ